MALIVHHMELLKEQDLKKSTVDLLSGSSSHVSEERLREQWSKQRLQRHWVTSSKTMTQSEIFLGIIRKIVNECVFFVRISSLHLIVCGT